MNVSLHREPVSPVDPATAGRPTGIPVVVGPVPSPGVPLISAGSGSPRSLIGPTPFINVLLHRADVVRVVTTALTPALSPGERESVRPREAHENAPDGRAVWGVNDTTAPGSRVARQIRRGVHNGSLSLGERARVRASVNPLSPRRFSTDESAQTETRSGLSYGSSILPPGNAPHEMTREPQNLAGARSLGTEGLT